MTSRFTLLPDPRFAALSAQLADRVNDAAHALTPDNFPDILDPLLRRVLADAFAGVGANGGAIWLADAEEQHLVPVYSTGPLADRFTGKYRQPLDRGLISLVYKKGQPIAEHDVYRNQQQDKTLDGLLAVLTCAMIAVPLYFAKQLRGVVSCVRLKPAGSPEPDPPGFSPDDLHDMERLSAILTRLLDHELVGATVGWVSARRRRS